MNSLGNNSNTLIKRNKLWHRIITKFIRPLLHEQKGVWMWKEKEENQPVFQSRGNVELSPKTKATPTVVSNSDNIMAIVSSYSRDQGTVLW